MKATKSQLTAFLTKLGIAGVELVEDADTTADFDPTAALSLVDASRKPIISQLLEGELTTKVHGEVAARVNRSLRKQLADITGVDKASLEGIESDAALTKALEHYKTTLSTSDAGKIDKILADHKTAIADIEKRETDKYNALDQKYTRKAKLEIIHKIHKDAKGLPTTANRERLAEDFLNDLERVATVKLNEAGTDLELYDIANPANKLLNGTSTDWVKVTDRIEPYYKDRGLWSSDMRGEPPLNGNKPPTETNLKAPPELRTGSVGAAQAQFAAQFETAK